MTDGGIYFRYRFLFLCLFKFLVINVSKMQVIKSIEEGRVYMRMERWIRVTLVFILALLVFVPFEEVSAACGVSDKGISSSPYGGTWGIHPELQKKADALISKAKDQGITVTLTQGYRSIAYQNSLYAQGRSCGGQVVTNAKGGESYHNFGLAFDIFVGDWNTKVDKNGNGKSDWTEVGEIGEGLGLEWGGKWKGFVDLPHFQYTYGLSLKKLNAGELPPEGKAIPNGDEASSAEIETDSKKLNGDDFKGDLVDISAYFVKGDVAINNVGVDDRKVEVSNENRYGMFVLGGKVGQFFYTVAQVMSVFLMGYIAFLWLLWFLSFSSIGVGQLLIVKLTFGKIDVYEENGLMTLVKWSLFGMFVIVAVWTGLIPKLFSLIYWMLSEFIGFLDRFTFL